MSIEFLLNHQHVRADEHPGMLVLDWLRQRKRLTGTKEGCKEGDCGACSVMIGVLGEDGQVVYKPVTSCLTPIGELHGKHLLSIEGLNLPIGSLNPVQAAMVGQGGAQCGYCTPGFIVSMCWYMMYSKEEAPSASGFKHAISGNLCRCTGYGAINRASDDLVAAFGPGGELDGVWQAEDRVAEMVERGLLPEYLTTIPERLKALAAGAPKAPASSPHFVIAGGTDLYVQRGEEIPTVDVEVLNHRPELEYVRLEGDEICVGGLTTFEAFADEPLIQAMIPSIKADMELIASLPIRNRATLSGNLINASPIGDMTSLLLALGTRVTLRAEDGAQRTLPLNELYLGYKTLAKSKDEIVVELRFDAAKPDEYISFEKVSKRRCLDIATVNSSARIELDGAGNVSACALSLGGVAAIPLYLKAASAYLVGKPINAATVRATVEVALGEISPISDVRGSADYKRLLSRQLLIAHFDKLFGAKVSLASVLGPQFASVTSQEVSS